MSFWTKPIGQTLAERKGKPYYKPMFFGTTKLGYIELKSDGRITYQARLDNRTDKTKFDAADITAVSIETAEDYVARVSGGRDRKSTRLNSSHVAISYAVFCLKKNTRSTAILGWGATQSSCAPRQRHGARCNSWSQ